MTTEAALSTNIEYFTDPKTGRPISNGFVYVGIPDLDPSIKANRVTVTIIQEDGTRVDILPSVQPLSLLNGELNYLGSPVVLLIAGSYSLKVVDKIGSQIRLIPRANEWAEGDISFVKANKSAAVLIQPVAGKTLFVESSDGGLFKSVTGAAAGTYSDNGGAFCGTQFIPTGGDGSSAWTRNNVGLGVLSNWFGTGNDAVILANIYCNANFKDLVIDEFNIKMTQTLFWNPQRYSIIGSGIVTLDFTDAAMTDTVCIEVEGDISTAGRIWNTNTTEFNGIILECDAALTAFKIGSVTADHQTPSVTIRNMMINNAGTGVLFNDDTWIVSFERSFFRNNSYCIDINTITNSGENMQFNKCAFSGALTSVINHTAGSVEVNFDGCSFDYNAAVINYTQNTYRAIIRFINGCHFEDNGSTVQFNLTTGTNGYYIYFDHSDWFYTGTIPNKIMDISTTGNNSTVVSIKNCDLPIFQTSQDRSSSDLFSNADKNMRLIHDNVSIEFSTNTFTELLSQRANAYPDMIAANISNAVFQTSGSGALSEVTASPSWSPETTAIKATEAASFWTTIACQGHSRFDVIGNLYRTTADYTVQIRYLTSEGIQISVDTVATPGTLNAWVRFGLKAIPPVNTAKIRVQFSAAGAVGEFQQLNNVIVVLQ